VLVVLALAPFGAVQASATNINSGDPAGAYYRLLCPPLENQLRLAEFDYRCTPSSGAAENIQRVLADPRQIGFAQLDAFALDTARLADKPLVRLRVDDARECLFAVTRAKDIASYGDLAAYAGRLRFILPPQNSGSAATFRFLQQADADGLGQASAISYAGSVDDAIRQALSADDTVTLFVRFPDPDSEPFRLVQTLGGKVVPVIDRAILRQQIEGLKVYFAQEVPVSRAKWTKGGKKAVTACTPVVVFTGSPERLSGKAQQEQRDLIATVTALKSDVLLPKQSLLAQLFKRTRELSGQSLEKLIQASEEARIKARPYIEKAKPYVDRAKEAAKPALDKAMEAGEHAIEAAGPALEAAKEAGARALQRAKEGAKDILDERKPVESPPPK
jgi:hypothetical protein